MEAIDTSNLPKIGEIVANPTDDPEILALREEKRQRFLDDQAHRAATDHIITSE